MTRWHKWLDKITGGVHHRLAWAVESRGVARLRNGLVYGYVKPPVPTHERKER